LKGPKLATLIFALYRNGEGVAVLANPPLRGIQWARAFEWATTPAPKFRLPFVAS